MVRIHPAESKGGFSTDQPLEEEIRNKFPNLPDHIKIISPESDISSYTLAEISKANVIYGTNMGLEIAIKGLPLVIVGECIAKGKGFSHDISSKEEYYSLIRKGFDIKLPSKNQIKLARKYAYYLFFKRWIDFTSLDTPVTGKKLSRELKLNFNSISELKQGNDTGLDLFCDGVISKTKIVQN